MPDQSQAWTCNVPTSLYLVDVQSMDGEPPTAAYQLKLAPSEDSIASTKYAWGARIPAILEHEKLRLVREPFEPDRGPAWWVQISYNKTVVLPEDRISRSGATDHVRRNFYPDADSRFDEEMDDEREQRRDAGEDFGEDKCVNDMLGKQFQVSGPKEGDKLWICTWPDTILEVFVYARQNNTYSPQSSTTSAPSFPYFSMPINSKFPHGNSDGEKSPWMPSAQRHRGAQIPRLKSRSRAGQVKNPHSAPHHTRRSFRVSERRMAELANSFPYCEQVEIIDGGKDHRPVVDAETGYSCPHTGTDREIALSGQQRGLDGCQRAI